MDERQIKYLASIFRSAIGEAHRRGLFLERPFSQFPDGCCGDVCDLLGQFFLEHRVHSRYICGTYRKGSFEDKCSHAWLEIDGIVVDITADQKQFRNGLIFKSEDRIPCYVGKYKNCYLEFDIENFQCRNICGLRNLGQVSFDRLRPIYNTIIQILYESELEQE